MKKHTFKLLSALTLSCGLLAPTLGLAQTVSVSSIVEHPALDAIKDGVHEALQEAGITERPDFKWQFQTAQGNPAIASQIARKFIGDKSDVIVAISTPSAQAVVAGTRSIPVVYSAVTDPVAAQLVKGMEASGTNVTGVSDALSLEDQLALIKQIVPNAKKVGMVYNPGETKLVFVGLQVTLLLL